MARFLKGITGAYSGKVGSVIGSSWRNVDYVRSQQNVLEDTTYRYWSFFAFYTFFSLLSRH